MKYSSKTLELSDKLLTLETGKLAQQATSSVMGRLGDTVVLSTVVMGEENTQIDYFPLTVEYIERLYAGGRIKGSRWVKREGRPSDDAILKARLIDRSIRPLFPKELKKEVQVVLTVLSVDGVNDPDILAIITTSAALAISRIPWNGPISAVRIGLVKEGKDGKHELLVNPDTSEYSFLDLDMVVSSTSGKVVMIEAGARQAAEDEALSAIALATETNKKVIDFIEEFTKEVGEKKEEVFVNQDFNTYIALIQKSYASEIHDLVQGGVSREVGISLDALFQRVLELEQDTIKETGMLKKAIDYVFKKKIREMILKHGKRPDGRTEDEVRPLTIEVGMLPRTHGSAIFQRGETQVLSVATLGIPSLEQLIESPEGEEAKRYMHHYSMPPYASGETGRMGALSRREIGHGALAERSLEPVIPSESEFPYAIRVVSEVMSSNGSTSMASTCGSTLALMDAGVPISEPVAGIAMGLITDGSAYKLLTDIIGLEDFSGDMDFKVAGTKKGITAIQLDVKIDGLTLEMIEKTLSRASDARGHILEKMMAVISVSRKGVSRFAPKVKVIKIDKEKIGDVIGSGGKVIRTIIASTNADVEVDDDGNVTIASIDEASVEKAASWINLLTRDIEKGEMFEGKVKRMMPFGAFVEIFPGKEGLVHVSEMSTGFVKDPQDVVQIGQSVKVRVKKIDEQGRIDLSMLFGEDAQKKEQEMGRERMRERTQMRPRFHGARGQPRFERRKRF